MQIYVHNQSQCEHIGRRIGVLLARGDYEGGFRSLAYAVDHELMEQPASLPELPLAQIAGIDLRLMNALDVTLGIRVVRDLAGVPVDRIAAIPNVAGRCIEQLAGSLQTVGVPFPVPADFDFSKRWAGQSEPEPRRREMSDNGNGHGGDTLVDMLSGLGESDLQSIDHEIGKLQKRIAKLKAARKVIATISGLKPTRAKRETAKGKISDQIEELIGKSGPMEFRQVAKRIGQTPAAVAMSVGRCPNLIRKGDIIELQRA